MVMLDLARLPFGEAWRAVDGPPGDAASVRSRLAMYRRLVEDIGPAVELSPFWGYASQLAWQQRSGRLGTGDRIAPSSWWGACNFALSVVPYVAAAQLALVPPFAAALDGYAPALARWREALTLLHWTRPGDDLDAARVAIWRAHLESIEHAVRTSRAAFDALPPDERTFARGWVRMVELFGAAGWRTDYDRVLSPGGELPSRVLAPGIELTPGERRTVRRMHALAARPPWRWSLEAALWRRTMRTRQARAEAEEILAAALGGGSRATRLRALRYTL